MRTQVEQKFTEFHERWFTKLEAYRAELLSAPEDTTPKTESLHATLVSKLTSHIKEYYSTKWEMAKDDVLAFYSTVWLNPLENAHLWVTGWKPSMLFCVVDKLTGSLSEEQVKQIDDLKVKIKAEEDKVEREMERQQVGLADRQMVELARTAIRAKTTTCRDAGDVAVTALSEFDGSKNLAVKSLLVSLERLMKASDCVRLKALKWVLDVLSPKQCVEFLAAEASVHIQLRQLGGMRQQSDSEESAFPVDHEASFLGHAHP